MKKPAASKNILLPEEIAKLLACDDPETAWDTALGIARRINPDYDPALARIIFDDVMRLFHGAYRGYCPIKTLYHNLPHTLAVFLCAVRLLHGVHVTGTRISDDEITLVMIATLMHDVGYAQQFGEETGTGAQFTLSHVRRGVAFMRRYLAERQFPHGLAESLAPMMLATDRALSFSELDFPDERTRLLGKIVGTADLTGQMADRAYLEKLLFLYLEFKEANFGNYQSIHDLLRQTKSFYQLTRQKMDGELDGMYTRLSFHFKDTLGVDTNYYQESIEKNIAYLEQVILHNETEYLSMLKRGGIVEKAQGMVVGKGPL